MLFDLFTRGFPARPNKLQVAPGLPSFVVPDLPLFKELWPAAIGIALMSFVETIAAGQAFRASEEPRPEPNKELLAIGLTNLVGGFFRNLPSGGGTSQTAVHRRAGARPAHHVQNHARPLPARLVEVDLVAPVEGDVDVQSSRKHVVRPVFGTRRSNRSGRLLRHGVSSRSLFPFPFFSSVVFFPFLFRRTIGNGKREREREWPALATWRQCTCRPAPLQ